MKYLLVHIHLDAFVIARVGWALLWVGEAFRPAGVA
jgi:hypothetical protein